MFGFIVTHLYLPKFILNRNWLVMVWATLCCKYDILFCLKLDQQRNLQYFIWRFSFGQWASRLHPGSAGTAAFWFARLVVRLRRLEFNIWVVIGQGKFPPGKDDVMTRCWRKTQTRCFYHKGKKTLLTFFIGLATGELRADRTGDEHVRFVSVNAAQDAICKRPVHTEPKLAFSPFWVDDTAFQYQFAWSIRTKC